MNGKDDFEMRDHAPLHNDEYRGERESPREAPNVVGMTDPTKGRAPAKDWRRAALVLAVSSLVFLGLLFYMGADLMRTFGLNQRGSGTSGKDPTFSETDYLRQQEELKEREQRLKTLESEREQMDTRMRARIEDAKREMANEWNAKLAESIATLNDTLIRQQAEHMEALYQMEMRLKKPDTPVRSLEGSTKKSVVFSSVAEVTARQEQAETELAKRAATPPNFTIGPGVMRGATIPAVLETTLISSKAAENFFARAVTTEAFEVSPGYVLPPGSVFLGRVRSDFDARRIYVEVEHLQVGATEVAVKGTMLDERGNPGLVTKYIDPLNQALWSSILPSMAAAVADAAKEYTKTVNSVTGATEYTTKPTARNTAYQGMGDALRLQSEILLEMQARKKPVILVKSGIPVMIQTTEKIPLELLVESRAIRAPEKRP